MFGFIGKFKTEVTAAFADLQVRLASIESKVETLFAERFNNVQHDVPAEPAVAKDEADGKQ